MVVSAGHNRAVTHWAGHSLPMNLTLTLDRSDSTHCAFAEADQAWFEFDLQASLVHLALRSVNCCRQEGIMITTTR